MKIPLSLQIALRFSLSQQRNGMVSLISVISTIGIMLGVAVLIIGLSAMNGFEYELNNRILAVVAHGEIEPVNPPFTDWPTILKRIKQIPGIIAAAPYLNFAGLIEHDDKLQSIQVKGVDPELELQISSLLRYIKGDIWSHFRAGHKQIIIGKGVADTLNVKSGDYLTLIIPNSNLQMKLLQPKRIRLQVGMILTLHSQLDNNFAMIPLADAQNYLHRGEDVGGIAIKVSNVFNANKLVQNAGNMTNNYVKIRSWINTYGYIYRDIQMIRAIMYLTMILVIGVACFNIVSTLVMAIKDKSTDIAILRTLGAKDELTRDIFIWYGLLTGLTGSTIGAVVGVFIAFNLTTLVKELERLFSCHLILGKIYFIDFLPTKLYLVDVISVLVTAIVLSLLASWYPAWCVSRISPARILGGQ